MLEPQTRSSPKQWGFLFTEMVLIVASILFAFALDSWWDERKDRVEGMEILQGLQEEFLQNRSKLEYRIERHADNLQAMRELYGVLAREGRKPGQADTDLDLDVVLAALLSPPTTDLGNGVLEALISAGRLELIPDDGLRAKLAGWAGVFEEVRDDELMTRKLVFDDTVRYLVQSGIPVSGAFSTWPEIWQGSFRSLNDDADARARLLSDPAFMTLLEIRIGYKSHTTGEYQAALEAVNRILDGIDTSLGAATGKRAP